jgi:endonuclease YncB( thermonuclease family)
MSLIQWSVPEPFSVLIQFQHMHAGLTFNRNGSTFPDSYIVLKSNEDLLGNWTEIIFNTNWHPDPEKGFMKVWIDGKLKVDFKGRANAKKGGKLSLRYGLYSSYISYYKNTFKTKKMPQRIAFYDGVKAEKNCQKLLDLGTCENLVSQNIKEYKLFIHDSNDKELHPKSICKITPANFEANERAALLGVEYNQGVNLCTFVKPTELFTTIEASDAFDGSYSFTLSRFNPSEGSMKLGFGQLEISDGKISVAKKSRSLKTSSTTYYDTFEGQIDKEGNISAVFNVNALNGEGIPQPVVFTGTIDALQIKGKFNDYFEMIIKFNKKAKQITTTKATKVATSDSDPTVSKVIEVIHGDRFIVDIAEPHELAGSNITLIIRDANTPDATKSCSKQMELGIKVKDFVSQKLADASSIKLKNYRKTSKAVIAQVIVDGKDLGEELIAKGYASSEYGHWKAYFCSALQAMAAGDSNWKYGSTVDADKAIFWYERAIFLDPDRDQKLVTYDLGMIYMMNGDTKKSIDYLKQSAKLGFMKAEEALGSAYMNGIGVSKDPAQAKKWLKKAHENGSDSAEDICGCEF